MKRFIFAGFLGLLTLSAFAQSNELDFYTRRFNSATTVVDQLGVLQIAASEKPSDSGSFFTDALKRIVEEYPHLSGNQELNAADEAIRLIADQVSTQAYAEAAPELWKAMQTFENPVVKMDTLIALGEIGAADYIPAIVLILRHINLYQTDDRVAQERIAYGAIHALEKMASGNRDAYLEVYYSVSAWYGKWVRTKANESLASIFEDPAEPLSSTLADTYYTYKQRHGVLDSIDSNDKISTDAKANAAAIGLAEGWKNMPQLKDMVSMRKFAIDMIAKYGASDDYVYPLLSRSYRTPYDIDEQLRTVHALSTLKNEQSANLLASFVEMCNYRCERGSLRDADERLMRALIPALGATGGSDNGNIALQRVLDIQQWTNVIHNLASKALKKE
ncbi:MAG: hypothetical protein LBS86_03210 [Treponema sp.]|nr:hypothetical protein [Treponema sp.]